MKAMIATTAPALPGLDALLCQLADAALAMPVVAEPSICRDKVDTENYGAQLGTDYTVGKGKRSITAHIPNRRSYPHIEIVIGDVSVHLEDLERSITQLIALLADPRFQKARATWHRGAQR